MKFLPNAQAKEWIMENLFQNFLHFTNFLVLSGKI